MWERQPLFASNSLAGHSQIWVAALPLSQQHALCLDWPQKIDELRLSEWAQERVWAGVCVCESGPFDSLSLSLARFIVCQVQRPKTNAFIVDDNFHSHCERAERVSGRAHASEWEWEWKRVSNQAKVLCTLLPHHHRHQHVVQFLWPELRAYHRHAIKHTSTHNRITTHTHTTQWNAHPVLPGSQSASQPASIHSFIHSFVCLP